MAQIALSHAHTMSKADAKTAVERVGSDLEDRLDATSQWDGDTLRFERSGASGQINVHESEVDVAIDLSWWVPVSTDRVRSEAEALLEEHLSQNA
jgi:putative polyhydroxyalkanoate system protein